MNDRAAFGRLLVRHFSVAGKVSECQIDLLWQHYDLLLRWNRILNLTGIKTMERAVLRHYCESLFAALHLPTEPVSVLDIGSGAGFPGIPMAIYRPDSRFTLAESHVRKAAFLREATRKLWNVRVIARRAGTIEEVFDWVVCRAVAWKQLRKHAGRLGREVALLVSRADADAVSASKGWEWRSPVSLPWSQTGVLLIGVACSTWNVPPLAGQLVW